MVVDTHSTNELLETWGTLDSAAILGAVILGISSIIAVIIYIVFRYKQFKAEQDAKNERLKEYRKMYSGMEKAIKDLSKQLPEALKKFEDKQIAALHEIDSHLISLANGFKNHKEQTDNLSLVLGRTKDITEEVLTLTCGTIGLDDSLSIVKTFFLNVAYYRIEKIIHKSLIENDYESRSEWVMDHVKSEIGDILSECRSNLNEIGLSVPVAKFFKIDSGQAKERFILCNIIWNELEEFYTSPRTYEQKMEESSLKLKNIIKDYLAEVCHQLESSTGFINN